MWTTALQPRTQATPCWQMKTKNYKEPSPIHQSGIRQYQLRTINMLHTRLFPWRQSQTQVLLVRTKTMIFGCRKAIALLSEEETIIMHGSDTATNAIMPSLLDHSASDSQRSRNSHQDRSCAACNPLPLLPPQAQVITFSVTTLRDYHAADECKHYFVVSYCQPRDADNNPIPVSTSYNIRTTNKNGCRYIRKITIPNLVIDRAVPFIRSRRSRIEGID